MKAVREWNRNCVISKNIQKCKLVIVVESYIDNKHSSRNVGKYKSNRLLYLICQVSVTYLSDLLGIEVRRTYLVVS